MAQQPPQYAGYPPEQPGYAPQPGYAQQPGYAPQPGYGAPQPSYHPAPVAQQQSTSNVVVVNSQPAAATVHTTVVRKDGPNHLLHFIICLICPWWIFVWIIVCIASGC